MRVYIYFMNKDKNYNVDKKEFTEDNALADAVAWGRANLENFNADMINFE